MISKIELMNAAGICQLLDDKLTNLIHGIIVLIKFGVPILLIIFGMLDFAKAVIAGKDDELKKSQKIFIKRLISAIVVFFVISITQFVISLADESDSEIWKCASAIMNGTNQGISTPETQRPTTYVKDENTEESQETNAICSSEKIQEEYQNCREKYLKPMCDTIFQERCYDPQSPNNILWDNLDTPINEINMILTGREIDNIDCSISSSENKEMYQRAIYSCIKSSGMTPKACVYYFYPYCVYKQDPYQEKENECCHSAGGIMTNNYNGTINEEYKCVSPQTDILPEVDMEVYNQCIND